MLRAARLNKGLSLTAISKSLKIKKPFIDAIEKGRYGELPGPTYAIGFLRAYASYVELDDRALVARFKRENGEPEPDESLNFPTPIKTKDGRLPMGAVLSVSVLLSVVGYGAAVLIGDGAFSSGKRVASSASTPPPVGLVQKAALVTGDGTPGGHAGVRPQQMALLRPALRSEAATRSIANGGIAPHIAGLPRAKPEPPTRPVRFAAKPAPAGPQAARMKPAVAANPPVAVPKGPARRAVEAAPVSGRARIVLRATKDTRITLRRPDGTVVFDRILKAGEVYPVMGRRALVLSAQDAGSLRVAVDGRMMPPLGRAGQARRGVKLDADGMLAHR